MFIDGNYLDDRVVSPSVGLPPLGSFEHSLKTEGSRKKRVAKHLSDPSDMLKLATRNAVSGSHSFENLSTMSKSPRNRSATKACPNFEILLKHSSESDILLMDEPPRECDRDSSDGGQDWDKRDIGSRHTSFGSSYEFDSGISSLTSVSSAKSVIQLTRSTSLRVLNAQQLELIRQQLLEQSMASVEREDNADVFECDCEYECAHPKSPQDHDHEATSRWNFRSLPAMLMGAARPRSDSDSRPSITGALAARLFRGRHNSRVYPDPDCTAKSNQQDDVLDPAEEAAMSASPKGPRRTL